MLRLTIQQLFLLVSSSKVYVQAAEESQAKLKENARLFLTVLIRSYVNVFECSFSKTTLWLNASYWFILLIYLGFFLPFSLLFYNYHRGIKTLQRRACFMAYLFLGSYLSRIKNEAEREREREREVTRFARAPNVACPRASM